jgi:hypothetical protein
MHNLGSIPRHCSPIAFKVHLCQRLDSRQPLDDLSGTCDESACKNECCPSQFYSPTPDIQTNLDTAVHRHTGMKTLFPSFTINIEVFPENSSACFWQERNAILLGLLAVYKLTPTLVLWSGKQWEVCTSTCTVGFNIHHECTDSVCCL